MDGSGREQPKRDFRSSTRENSEFKWKIDRTVVGSFEIEIDPAVDLRADMILHKVHGYEEEFKGYCQIWNDLKLRDEFIEAYENIPPCTTCCGLVEEQDKTIKQNAKLLKEGWVKTVNETVLQEKGFRISFYVWKWNNISGKAETVIPMIRFHSLQ